MKLIINKIKKYDDVPYPRFAYNDEQAGIDIFSTEYILIPAKEKVIIKTGIKMQVKLNFFERIFFKGFVKLFSRSGLSVKDSIESGAGVIDSDYTGEVRVVLYNHSDSLYAVHKGDRISQAVPFLIPKVKLVYDGKITETHRGENGLGSSGK